MRRHQAQTHRIFRDAPATTLLVALMVTLGTFEAAGFGQSKQKAAAQQSNVETLKAQIGSKIENGGVVPPDSATVYVLFSAAMEGRSFSHPIINVDTAGGQFSYNLNNLLAKNKELKSLEKRAVHNPPPEAARPG